MQANIKFETVQQYHNAFDGQTKQKLDEIRKILQQLMPNAVEVISYNMPAYKLDKVVCYYAGYKNHIGFYPTSKPIEVFKQQLLPYKTSKGAIQFVLTKKIPATLIKQIVQFRITDMQLKNK